MSFFSAFGAGFSAFGEAFRKEMAEGSKSSGSASEAKERLTFTLRVDRTQCQTLITPEKLTAITQDLEKIFPEIVRRHINAMVAGTRVALETEEGGRAPVIRAEFNLRQQQKNQTAVAAQ